VGRLKLTGEPKAVVYIDDQTAVLKEFRKVDIVVEEGRHKVTVEAAGHEVEVLKVDIVPGEVKKLHVTLCPAGQNRDQMVKIPGGTLEMGLDEKRVVWLCKKKGSDCISAYKSAVPKHDVPLKPFSIDKYEVTNRQYKKFISATGHKPPKHWRRGEYPRGKDDYPVVNVSWEDAKAYCQWAGKRLPTEAEWEYAARASKGFIYPWGQKFRIGRANVAGSLYRGLTITGRYAKGASRFGCLDMSGNVWEWTASRFIPYPGSGLEPPSEKNLYVIRGGSYKTRPYLATAVYRQKLPADSVREDLGFRCAR